MRVKVKICGITSTEDALNVSNAGADAVGLVFYEKSPRNIAPQKAAEICDSLPPFITIVGLFLDAPKEFVNSVLESVPLDLLQFHGSESPEYCQSFGMPYIKAVGMKSIRSEEDFNAYANLYKNAKGFLVDSHATGKAGGTGQTFDWSTIPQTCKKLIILAGGLKPENVADALEKVSVYAIDLSSGVEHEPGIKDNKKIMKLMEEVKRVHCDERR